jgi:hypothetical protein
MYQSNIYFQYIGILQTLCSRIWFKALSFLADLCVHGELLQPVASAPMMITIVMDRTAPTLAGSSQVRTSQMLRVSSAKSCRWRRDIRLPKSELR